MRTTVLCIKAGGEFLKQDMRLKRRRELEVKMSKVFEEHVKVLPKEMQGILVDDLVTAFQNRMSVLNRARD